MPMYFDLSFLVNRDKESLYRMRQILFEDLDIGEGENHLGRSDFAILKNRIASLAIFDNKTHNFVEFMLGFPCKIFHKNSFNKELESLVHLVEFCFKKNCGILYVLCSYELNGYILGGVTDWKRIDSNLLKKFPIAFVNKKIKVGDSPQYGFKLFDLFVNHKAQDLF